MREGFILLLGLLGTVLSDTYLHNPRGSNNRLNERSATRRNANRLFDSQNNNRGGYNTGDAEDGKADNDPTKQYSMSYYQSGGAASEESQLIVEWTNQHGCGGSEDSSPHKLNCDIVIQYMCQNDFQQAELTTRANNEDSKRGFLRDGTDTNTQQYQNPNNNEDSDNNNADDQYANRISNNLNQIQMSRGLHERMISYDMCKFREANDGLFTADQRLNNGGLGYVDASRTRQNPNGQRRGYECPEERDYFPYWQPTLMTQSYDDEDQTTPWIDLAFLTSNTSRCDVIKAGSFNQNGKERCVLTKGTTARPRTYGRSITEADCTAEDGTWVTFHSYLEILDAANTEAKCTTAAAADSRNKISWMALRSDETAASDKMCVVQAPVLDCTDAPWTRVNHNGNSPDAAGNASRYDSTLPHFASGTDKRCVMRLRYNITTDDYDPFNTDSNSNQNIQEGIVSPIEQNPLVDVGASGRPLRLALNTNQYGRTFQDRTHAYRMLPRTTAMAGKLIHNLNVRGKRGNIVQTYPAVEYDFIPNRATISTEDLVHIQWTGSNSHNNQPNGGDGQTGDAGEGKGGTDRSNFLESQGEIENYPAPYENTTVWSKVKSLTTPTATGKDIAVGLFSSGYYCGAAEVNGGVCSENGDQILGEGDDLNNLLNNAPASYFGHVLEFTEAVTVPYMCSRNNNFSNRSQKGILWVVSPADAAAARRRKREIKTRK